MTHKLWVHSHSTRGWKPMQLSSSSPSSFPVYIPEHRNMEPAYEIGQSSSSGSREGWDQVLWLHYVWHPFDYMSLQLSDKPSSPLPNKLYMGFIFNVTLNKFRSLWLKMFSPGLARKVNHSIKSNRLQQLERRIPLSLSNEFLLGGRFPVCFKRLRLWAVKCGAVNRLHRKQPAAPGEKLRIKPWCVWSLSEFCSFDVSLILEFFFCHSFPKSQEAYHLAVSMVLLRIWKVLSVVVFDFLVAMCERKVTLGETFFIWFYTSSDHDSV